MSLRSIVVSVAFLAPSALAQEVQLLEDLHQAGDFESLRVSFPRDFVRVDVGPATSLCYIAYEAGYGWGAYETTLASGITRAIFRGGEPSELTQVGDLLFFAASSLANGRELWSFDLTGRRRTGELVLHELRPGIQGSDPRDLVAHDATTLLFAADDGIVGRELWRSDGTVAGTRLVVDLEPGPRGSEPSEFYVVGGGRTYFSASRQGTTVLGPSLWRTDGTANGTQFSGTLTNNNLADSPVDMTQVGSEYWVLGRNQGVIRVDTRSDTHDLLDIPADRLHEEARLGSAILVAQDRTSLLPSVWFAATNSSPVLLRGPSASEPNVGFDAQLEHAASLGSSLLFAGRGFEIRNSQYQSQGEELWITDGTKAGTTLLRDIVAGDGSSAPRDLVRLGTRVLFSAWDPQHGRELWVSDGTIAGTQLLRDLSTGMASGMDGRGIVIGNEMFFSGNGALYRTDGTAAGTKSVRAIPPPNPDASPDYFAATPTSVCFVATSRNANDTIVRELHRASPQRNGPHVVQRIAGDASFVCTIGESVYSVQAGGIAEGDSVQVAGADFEHLTPIGQDLVYATESPARVYRWDRSGAPVLLLSATSAPGWVPNFARLGETSRFVFAGPSDGELWISDGTAAGTQRVLDVDPVGESEPRWMTSFESRVVFSADDGTSGRELWITDGSAAGTIRVADLAMGAGSSDPRGFAVQHGLVFFFANGDELWKSDGTTSGTQLVTDLQASTVDPSGLTAVGTRHVLFRAQDPQSGVELFVSDGTANGTRLAADIRAGSGDGLAESGSELTRYRWSFAVVEDRVYFGADDGTHGEEPWFWTNGATAWTGEAGCGTTTRVPVLRAQDPVLASAQELRYEQILVGALGVTVVGFRGASMVGSGCVYRIDPWKPWFVLDAWQQGSAPRTTQVPIPNDSSLAGLRLTMQTLVAPTDAPNGLDLSNAIHEVIGR
ncbi:MAG: hypothetical protein H6832_17480 [Planctomycetes bacterium]|nr:hypothetical protein [Planctomycetota bacterium]